MKEKKTTIFGTVASISGAVATNSTGIVQLVAGLIAAIFGSLFAHAAKDITDTTPKNETK
jgi:hypothetical protein